MAMIPAFAVVWASEPRLLKLSKAFRDAVFTITPRLALRCGHAAGARLQGDHCSTGGASRRNGGLRSVDVEITPNDQRALPSKGQGGCSAHAAARAGDDANFSR
jgi:hypothetical protein